MSRSWRQFTTSVLAGAVVLAALAAGQAVAAGMRRATSATPAGTITSFAGGVGGPGIATEFGVSPYGLAFANGDLYVATYRLVRETGGRTDFMTTPVGPVVSDSSHNGGLAESFALTASSIMADGAGNLLLSTPGHIWVVAHSTGNIYGRAMVKGHIYSVAKVRPGASARAIDPHGNFVLANQFGNKILVHAMRSGDFYGRPMVAGRTYTVAGTGTPGRTGDGGPAVRARLDGPTDVAVDRVGNLVIADTVNSRIRVVPVKTGWFYGLRMHKGNIYTIVYRNGTWFNGGDSRDGGKDVRG